MDCHPFAGEARLESPPPVYSKFDDSDPCTLAATMRSCKLTLSAAGAAALMVTVRHFLHSDSTLVAEQLPPAAVLEDWNRELRDENLLLRRKIARLHRGQRSTSLVDQNRTETHRASDYPRAGVCAITSAGEGVHCSDGDVKGTWTVYSIDECREACRDCPRCQWFSHNPDDGDCSWFYECTGFRNLRTRHTTYRARDGSDFLIAAPASSDTEAARACRLHLAREPPPPLPPLSPPLPPTPSSARRLRIGLATLLVPPANERATRRTCRVETGIGCALLPWCASVRRLQGVLTASPQLDVDVRLLVLTGSRAHEADAAVANAVGEQGATSTTCRFDAVDERDCPGIQRVLVSSDLIAASQAHVQRVISSGVMSYDAKYMRRMVVQLWKWELFRLGEYDVLLYSDLDVDLLPPPTPGIPWSRMLESVAAEWAQGLHQLMPKPPGAEASHVHMGYADATTPLNGGVFWVFPPKNDSLYRAGITVLDQGSHSIGTCHCIRALHLTVSAALVRRSYGRPGTRIAAGRRLAHRRVGSLLRKQPRRHRARSRLLQQTATQRRRARHCVR